jgi:hypothetical protein
MQTMPALPRIVSVLLGIVLATPVAAPQTAVAAPAGLPGQEADEARRLNAEAQQMFADGQYVEAARTYARILEVLPENKINREERDNTLLIALEVYREAYKQQRVPGNTDATRTAAKLLCTADTHYQKYLDTYRDQYGSAADPSKAARESYAELQAMMREAEGELGSSPCGPPPAEVKPPEEPKGVVDLSGPDPPRGPSGIGLIVGGAVALAGGLGATSMIIIGGINRRKAVEIRDDDMETDARREEARDNVRRANGLIVAGSVVTGVLLAGGATMLGIGIRRRMRYMAFSPQLNRGYVGLSLQGRF